MKKATNYSLLVYVLVLVLIYLVGSLVLTKGNAELNTQNIFVFYLIAIIISFVIAIVIMELGHVVGAKMGGYKILSISFLQLTFIRLNQKWKCAFLPFDGLTGETRIAPKKEKANPKPYFWMGTLFLVLLALVGIYVPYLIPGTTTLRAYFKYGGYILATISGLLILFNLLPFRMDTKNDAIMMRYVKKEKVTLFNQLGTIEENLQNGEPLPELAFIEDIDYLSARYDYYVYLQKLYAGNYEEAMQVLDALMKASEELPDAVYDELVAAKISLMLLTHTKIETQAYYTELPQQARKTMNLCNSVEGARNYFFISAIMNGNYEEAQAAYKKYISRRKQNREVGRDFDEEALMSVFMNKVHEAYPEWKFSKA